MAQVTLAQAKQIGRVYGIRFNKFTVDEFQAGLNTEMEHRDVLGKSLRKLVGVVVEHLSEVADYYHRLAVMKEQAKQGVVVNPVNKTEAAQLYQSFHETPSANTRTVQFDNPDPSKPLIKIGTVTEIRYTPQANSRHKGINFFHKSGDDGNKVMKSNWILACDADGANFYLLKENPALKRPFFSDRGIIG